MTKFPPLPLYLSPLFILLPPGPHSCLGSHSLFLTFWWNNQPPSLCVIFNYSLLSQLCSVLGCCVTQGTERWESTASFCSAVPASCRKSLHLFFSDWHIPLLVLHIIIFPFPFIRHLWWLRLLLEQHQVFSCLLVLLPGFPVFLTPLLLHWHHTHSPSKGSQYRFYSNSYVRNDWKKQPPTSSWQKATNSSSVTSVSSMTNVYRLLTYFLLSVSYSQCVLLWAG